MSAQDQDPLIVKFTKVPVRLSYPSLFEAKAFGGGTDGAKPKFSAVFLLDKKRNAADIKAMQTAIAVAIREGLKGKHPGTDKICLKDGSAKEDTDGYGPDVMFVSASSETRPGVVDKDLTPLVSADGKPYAGCYVYATIRLWAQDNKWGKRVNATLRNVQFVKDGEPFGEKRVAPEDEFDAIEDDGEDLT